MAGANEAASPPPDIGSSVEKPKSRVRASVSAAPGTTESAASEGQLRPDGTDCRFPSGGEASCPAHVSAGASRAAVAHAALPPHFNSQSARAAASVG